MAQYKLAVDVERCIGCHSCEVACKQEFNLPVGPQWIRVIKVGPRKIGKKLKMDFVPIFCKHCEKPPCIKVCPENALRKRPDGIVLVDKEKCTGCQLCIDACPINAPQLNPDEGVVGFCNFCAHRIDDGLEPICKIVCPARCIYFGDVNEINKMMQEKKVKDILNFPLTTKNTVGVRTRVKAPV